MRSDIEAQIDALRMTESEAGKVISEAFKELISTKYLYQSLQVEPVKQTPPQNLNKEQHFFSECYKSKFNELWYPLGLKKENKLIDGQKLPIPASIQFKLEIVKLFCPHCKSPEAIHPLLDLVKVYDRSLWEKYPDQHQLFILPYECQTCKGEPLIFSVKRNGLKLQLCGINFLTTPHAPPFIPKKQQEFFEEALLAQKVNKTLTAIFYLRVFIEQHWRFVLGQKANSLRPEEMGVEYRKTMKKELNDQIPSLSDVYEQLSKAIHEARADEELFEKMKSKIEHHFKQKEISLQYS